MSSHRSALSRVTLDKVTKLFGRHRALAGVSLTLEPGRACALLGPNGAGKSTLVGILSTLVRPTKGEVRFESAGATLPPHEHRGAIGLLAHEALVYGELNAIENLRFFAELYDVPDATARAARLLDEVGLETEARLRPARTYSRGMLQRLALARALLHDPALLLLDEPFTGLDRRGIQALSSTLARARDDRRIVLVVSHDLEALDGVCDHIVVIRRGQVSFDEHRSAPYSYAELRDAYHQYSEPRGTPLP